MANDLTVVKNFKDCKTREDFISLYWPRFQKLSLYENEHFRELFICLGEDDMDESNDDHCSFIVEKGGEDYIDTERIRELLVKRCLSVKNLKRHPLLYRALEFFSERNLICSLLMDDRNDDSLPLPYQFLGIAIIVIDNYPETSQVEKLFFDILRLACAISSLKESKEKSFYNFYSSVVYTGIVHYMQDEFYVHRLFRTAYRTVHQPKKDAYNQPDAWVKSKKDNFIPVEMKKGVFDRRALKQLERYIKAFDCEKGIAVGSTLNVQLPDYIKFISVSQLREKVEKDIWLFPPR